MTFSDRPGFWGERPPPLPGWQGAEKRKKWGLPARGQAQQGDSTCGSGTSASRPRSALTNVLGIALFVLRSRGATGPCGEMHPRSRRTGQRAPRPSASIRNTIAPRASPRLSVFTVSPRSSAGIPLSRQRVVDSLRPAPAPRMPPGWAPDSAPPGGTSSPPARQSTARAPAGCPPVALEAVPSLPFRRLSAHGPGRRLGLSPPARPARGAGRHQGEAEMRRPDGDVSAPAFVPLVPLLHIPADQQSGQHFVGHTEALQVRQAAGLLPLRATEGLAAVKPTRRRARAARVAARSSKPRQGTGPLPALLRMATSQKIAGRFKTGECRRTSRSQRAPMTRPRPQGPGPTRPIFINRKRRRQVGAYF